MVGRPRFERDQRIKKSAALPAELTTRKQRCAKELFAESLKRNF